MLVLFLPQEILEEFNFKANESAGAVRKCVVALMIAKEHSKESSPLGKHSSKLPLAGLLRNCRASSCLWARLVQVPSSLCILSCLPSSGKVSQATALSEKMSPTNVLLWQTKERRLLQRAEKIHQDL